MRGRRFIAAGRIALAVTLASTLACARLQPLPPWHGIPTSSEPFVDHPAMGSVPRPDRLLAGLTDGVNPVSHGLVELAFHPLHGELAVVAGSVTGSITTGLAEIYFVSSVTRRSPTGAFTRVGVLVGGRLADDRCRVLYAPWTDEMSPEAVEFVPAWPDSTPGERFVKGAIVGAHGYIVEARSAQLRRFDDEDGDGWPDAPSMMTPVDLGDPMTPRILGFSHDHRSWPDSAVILPSNRYSRRVVREEGGALRIARIRARSPESTGPRAAGRR